MVSACGKLGSSRSRLCFFGSFCCTFQVPSSTVSIFFIFGRSNCDSFGLRSGLSLSRLCDSFRFFFSFDRLFDLHGRGLCFSFSYCFSNRFLRRLNDGICLLFCCILDCIELENRSNRHEDRATMGLRGCGSADCSDHQRLDLLLLFKLVLNGLKGA